MLRLRAIAAAEGACRFSRAHQQRTSAPRRFLISARASRYASSPSRWPHRRHYDIFSGFHAPLSTCRYSRARRHCASTIRAALDSSYHAFDADRRREGISAASANASPKYFALLCSRIFRMMPTPPPVFYWSADAGLSAADRRFGLGHNADAFGRPRL